VDGRCEIASHLAERRGRILQEYRRALRDSDNVLARDENSLRQCVEQADRIIGSTIDQLLGVLVEQPDISLSQQIGVARAAGGIHPSESLRAASLLFSVTCRHLADRGDAPGVAWSAIADAITMFNDNLIGRIREGLFSYAGFLLARIDEERAAERQRLSRDIHDLLGHELAIVQQNLELFDMYLQTDRSEAERRAEAARELLRETIDRLPRLIRDLRLTLPAADMKAELLDYAASVSDATLHVTIEGDESWASPQVRGQSFLAIREALRNALAHGMPKNVWITVEVTPHEFVARIDDDGIGFDVEDRTERPTGSGLASMHERAGLLGGSLRISSQAGSGTHVELLIPLLGVRDAEGI
jgi:signal transduction histidine kinase